MENEVKMFKEDVELGLFDNAAQTYCDHGEYRKKFDRILEEKGLRKEVMDEVKILVEYLIEIK